MYKTIPSEIDNEMGSEHCRIDMAKNRYPFCIVWTPIPFLTWLCPIIGHMGIAMSSGVIRDFAGPYFVSEDNMAFGNPTKYWQLEFSNVAGGVAVWDRAVAEASDIYKERVHNLFCDNCHSHVGMALNLMQYDKPTSWNMVKLAFMMLIYGKYVNFIGILKTWLPFTVIASIIVVVSATTF